MLMDEEGGGISLESVRIEKERLDRWEQKLRQQEQRVQLELVALAEMRDDLASMQDSIDQQKKELEDLQGKMNSEAEKERQERLDKLAKLFTDSKAKVAAKLLMDRDIETTVEIIQRMKERDLIKIVEEMNKIPAQDNQPSGADRAQELLDLFAEKALEKKAQP